METSNSESSKLRYFSRVGTLLAGIILQFSLIIWQLIKYPAVAAITLPSSFVFQDNIGILLHYLVVAAITLPSSFVFLALGLLPFIIFFSLSKKMGTNRLVLISGLTLIIFHFFIIYSIFTDKNPGSLAAIGYFFLSLLGFSPISILFIPKNFIFRGVISILVVSLVIYFGYLAVLIKIAGNPTTAPQRLEEIAEGFFAKRSVSLQKKLAENPASPPHILISLANSKSKDVIARAGKNPNTPTETLVSIANKWNSDYAVIWGVAGNPNTPPDILWGLATRTSSDFTNQFQGQLEWGLYQTYVFGHLAANPSSTVEILREISKSQDYLVGVPLVQNPKTPCDVIEKIARTNPNQYLAQFAADTFKARCG